LKKDSYFCKPKFEEMSGRYAIPLSGLKEGHHTIDFKIGKEFFEQFEESEVKEGSLIANIEMDKRSSHLDFVLRISGSVRICCDRCLEMFFQPVNCENRLIVKFGKSIEDIDPDILSVPADEHELDLQQHIYEFILLALPIKRVHPDDNNENSTCDPEMLKKLEELIVEEENENDPRWDELKKLMNNN
jgi:uncharacterized metal-binding protein YceD (DUF177 family)